MAGSGLNSPNNQSPSNSASGSNSLSQSIGRGVANSWLGRGVDYAANSVKPYLSTNTWREGINRSVIGQMTGAAATRATPTNAPTVPVRPAPTNPPASYNPNLRISSGPRTDFVSTLGRYTAHMPPTANTNTAAATNTQTQNNDAYDRFIEKADNIYSGVDFITTSKSVLPWVKNTAPWIKGLPSWVGWAKGAPRGGAIGGAFEVGQGLLDAGRMVYGGQPAVDAWWKDLQTSGTNNNQVATDPLSYAQAVFNANSHGVFRNMASSYASNREIGNHLTNNARFLAQYAPQSTGVFDPGDSWRSSALTSSDLAAAKARLQSLGPGMNPYE